MDSHLVLALLFNSVLILICGYALIRGGQPERIGAAVNLLASLFTTLARGLHLVSAGPAESLVLITDLGVAAIFFWLAIRTTRFWPVWAFGFAMADVAISFAGPLVPKLELFAYQTGIGAYAYLALASLALGTYHLPRHASHDARIGWRQPATGA